MSATTRSLLAAERALTKVKEHMGRAEQSGDVDLSTGWRGYDELSLCLQAERFQSEDRDEALAGGMHQVRRQERQDAQVRADAGAA